MNRQAQTAASLLAKYGEPVTVTFTEGVVYNPITGEANGVAVTNAVNAVGYPARYHAKEVQNNVDKRIEGSVIQAGDIRLILELIDPAPVLGCLVTLGSTTYRIMDVQTITLSGSSIIFICQIRAN